MRQQRSEAELPEHSNDTDQISREEVAPSDLRDYEVADFTVWARDEPHLVPLAMMVEIVERIVGIEGPVHEEEIARRVATLFGKQKAGSRIVERAKAGATTP